MYIAARPCTYLEMRLLTMLLSHLMVGSTSNMKKTSLVLPLEKENVCNPTHCFFLSINKQSDSTLIHCHDCIVNVYIFYFVELRLLYISSSVSICFCEW